MLASFIFFLPLCFMLLCSPVSKPELQGTVTFAVFDVGQGLSQAICLNDTAVIIDCGKASQSQKFLLGYVAIGEPYVKAVIISHAHEDHYGGLSTINKWSGFSGNIFVSSYTDTLTIRKACGSYSNAITFYMLHTNDTLMILDNIQLRTLWPPKQLNKDSLEQLSEWKNRTSIVLHGQYGLSTFLITGDLDSANATIIARTKDILSDLVVVPHHGSGDAISPQFYGAIAAKKAIISCGLDNQYGHPHEKLTYFLAQNMLMTVHDTRFDSHYIVASNGEYWTEY